MNPTDSTPELTEGQKLEAEAYNTYTKKRRRQKMTNHATMAVCLIAAAAIAWKLDPINRALEKQGISLPN